MCTDGSRIDFAKKLCCMVNPWKHCVGKDSCGGIFCKHCSVRHACQRDGGSKVWINPATHLEGPLPDYYKYIWHS